MPDLPVDLFSFMRGKRSRETDSRAHRKLIIYKKTVEGKTLSRSTEEDTKKLQSSSCSCAMRSGEFLTTLDRTHVRTYRARDRSLDLVSARKKNANFPKR